MSDDETCDICRLPSRDHTKYGGCLAAASKENTTLRAENEALRETVAGLVRTWDESDGDEQPMSDAIDAARVEG